MKGIALCQHKCSRTVSAWQRSEIAFLFEFLLTILTDLKTLVFLIRLVLGFFLPEVWMLTVSLEVVEQFQALRQRVVAYKIRGSFTFNENRQTIQGERDY